MTTLTPPGPADGPLLVDVLRVAGQQRQRVATRAATELIAGDAKDHRTGAVRIAKLLAEAGRLIEVADLLEAGHLRLVAVDNQVVGVAVHDAKAGDPVDVIAPGPASLADADVSRETGPPADPTADRTLRVVPTPQEPPAVPPPTDAQADQAAADADAILAEAFPDDDPDLGTVLPEEGRAPAPRTPAVSRHAGARAADVVLGPEAGAGAVAEELAIDDYQLPAGQGDDDDLADLADVADSTGFDADAELDTP